MSVSESNNPGYHVSGRPSLGDKAMRVQAMVRLQEAEHLKLCAMAKRDDVSIAAFIRRAIMRELSSR
jgi:hypothetical protein